jgi:hypothetical protein
MEEILDVITGSVVQSKHVGRDIMAGFKTIVGGDGLSDTVLPETKPPRFLMIRSLTSMGL